MQPVGYDQSRARQLLTSADEVPGEIRIELPLADDEGDQSIAEIQVRVERLGCKKIVLHTQEGLGEAVTG